MPPLYSFTFHRFVFTFFSHRRWLRRHRWGELSVYSFILLASLTFFLIQLTTWGAPRFAQLQEFARTKAIVKETRIATKTVEGTTVYRPEVRIAYLVDEILYDRWTFDLKTLEEEHGFTSRRTTAESALLPFAIGKEIDGWYRLGDPNQAVVSWTFPIWGLLFLLLSLCLTVLGLVGVIRFLRQDIVSNERKAATNPQPLFFIEANRSKDLPTVPDIRSISESPGTHLAFRLPIGTHPLFPLVGLVLFGIAWNVVAWAVMFHSFLHPLDEWSDQIFGSALRSIFCGVGLLLLAAVFHRILLTFGVGPTVLEISDHPIHPGRRYRLRLHQAGILRFRELAVAVVCEETARFHQGTDTITSRKEVFRQPMFSRVDFETSADVPLEQEFFLQLPLGAMHSFRRENNEIQWKIDVFIKLIGWPNIHRSCSIVVMPTSISDGGADGPAIRMLMSPTLGRQSDQ